jgi:hypothetical protein
MTKRELAELALESLAIAAYEFDPSAAEWMSIVKRLEFMMAEWDSRGIRIGYIFSDPKTLSPSDPSGVLDWAAFPVANNLALRVGTMFGVEPSQDVRDAAKTGLEALELTTYSPIPMSYATTTPRGAGWRWMRPWNRFYVQPGGGIDVQHGSPIAAPYNPAQPYTGDN